MIKAMMKELEFRAKDWKYKEIDTIYFGGGTPSLLDAAELNSLLNLTRRLFDVSSDAEITLEANPDDLTAEKLQELFETGINRLSIGIQSFRDSDLKYMNRAHTSDEADLCVKLARDAGFSNISIDLIYALPDLGIREWEMNLQKAIDLNVQHISAYCLTIEEGTVLSSWIKNGKAKPVDEEKAIEQHRLLLEMLRKAGYEDYEISNFAKDKMYSRHNSAYWSGVPFLGIGPSAHGFDTAKRWWNIKNNPVYVKGWNAGKGDWEEEELTLASRFNEYVLTALRTKKGISLAKVLKDFGQHRLDELLLQAESDIQDGTVLNLKEHLVLTDKGKLIADHISMEFFDVE